MGHAQLKETHEVSNFISGQLGGEFSKVGFLNDSGFKPDNGEVLSMEDFIKAEESLGHAPSSLHDIEDAALNATARLENEIEHKTFLYSQKETGREQNGGASDDNTVSAIGRLKVGIQDADSDRRKREEKRNQQAYLALAREQMDYADQLQAEMNRLLEEINQLKEEIKALEEDSDIAKDLMENIDDLNSEDPDTRKSAISKTKAYLAKHNIDIDDFKEKDGSYDTKAIHDAIDHQHSENEKQITDKTDIIEAKEHKLSEINIEMDNITNSIDQKQTPPLEGDADILTAQSSVYNELLDDNIVDNAFDDIAADGAFDTVFGDIELAVTNTQQSEINSDQIAQLETFDTSRTVGSFAGTGENTESVITAHFTAKADVNQPTAEAEVSITQQNSYQSAPAIANGLG